MVSMLEYLAGLRKHGHRPVQIGEVVIGRTHYAAGEFVHGFDGGRSRIALMPMYRSDKVTHNSTGPTPDLLPPSYQRDRRTVYELNGVVWYISGWHTGRSNRIHAENHDGVLWLDVLPGDTGRFGSPTTMLASVHWAESFETAMALAGPEVRTRIQLA